MNDLVLGRMLYWILILLTLVFLAVSDYLPQSRFFVMASAIMLAFVVGARFADIGWSRWLGIGLVTLIVFVLPPTVYFVSPHELRDATYSALPAITAIPLIILVVFAGVMRGFASSGRIRLSQ